VVPPHDGTSAWQLWYGDCVRGCGTQLLLYANSTDGLAWQKPALGLFDLTQVRPDLASIGKANNVVLEGGGIGVYRDPSETDPSRRFKAFGPGCYGAGGASCRLSFPGGTVGDPRYPQEDLAVSADGLHWSPVGAVDWPAPQRYDCHNNLFFDAPTSRYIATTRDGFSSAPGRAIGIANSSSAALNFDTSAAPKLTLSGSMQHQLYSQITFPWHNAYLGIVMVYDAEDAAERVRCHLAWASSPLGEWNWLDAGGVTGREFIPLGDDGAFDSHVCFAASSPVQWKGEERLYFMGGNGPHSGERNSSLGVATLRQDGYASVRGSGKLLTVELLVTGPWLTVTADVDVGGGSVRVGVPDTGPDSPVGLLTAKSIPLTANGTAVHMTFEGGCGGPDFMPYIGKKIVLEAQLESASLYTIGFAPRGDGSSGRSRCAEAVVEEI